MDTDIQNAKPGERWLATMKEVDSTEPNPREAAVTVIDYEARTQVWSVEVVGGNGGNHALPAANLIRRL